LAALGPPVSAERLLLLLKQSAAAVATSREDHCLRAVPGDTLRDMASIEILNAGLSSHVPVAVLALAFTNLSVDSLKASAFFDLLAPPLHVVCLGVVLP
jgi:hypothetical protein